LIKKYFAGFLSLIVFSGLISPEPKVYFINLQEGDVVESPVFIQFGLSGKGIAPAGVARPDTGHHHLLIDVGTYLDYSKPIPATNKHIHFGGGQTETSIDLLPGQHELQLILGDLYHVPLSPPITSEKIKILVR